MEATIMGSMENSSPESLQDSPVSQLLKQSGRKPPRRGKTKGTGNDDRIIARKQMRTYFKKESTVPRKTGDNAKAADVGDTRSHGSSSAKETMLVKPYARSTFEAPLAGSSASFIYSDTKALVEEYVDLLVHDPGLDRLFTRLMMPTVLGPERFRRNYNRILQSYARDLKRQLPAWNDPKTPLRRQGLAFISQRSTTMKTARLIASRYMRKATQPQSVPRSECGDFRVSGSDAFSGNESSGAEPGHTFISELGPYFRYGEPFQRMRRILRNLFIPSTLLNDVRTSTELMLDLVFGDEYLTFVLFKAMSNPSVPLQDDRVDPTRWIGYFGSKLAAEAGSPDQLRVAEFTETYAKYISTRAVQRMEGMDVQAILRHSRIAKFIARDGNKINIQDIAHQESLTKILMKFHRIGDNNKSQESSGGRRINPFYSVGLAFCLSLTLYTYGGLIKCALLQLNQGPVANLTAILVFLYYSGDVFDDTIALILDSLSTKLEEHSEQGIEVLRYFRNKGTVGNGDDNGEKFQSHLCQAYRTYLLSRSEEVLETIIDSNLPNVCVADVYTHLDFIYSSEAFNAIFYLVRGVIPTFFSEAKKLVNEGLLGFEDPVTAASKPSLLSALGELEYCFMATGKAPTIEIPISEPSIENYLVSNSLKLSIEALSRSEWQWWPWKPPKLRRKFTGKECFITWACDCGERREEIVPLVYASKLRHLASQFPLSNVLPDLPPAPLGSRSYVDTETTSGSEAQAADLGAASGAGSSILRNATAATSPSSSVIPLSTPPKAFVYMVVKASRYTLAQIDVTEKNARGFFQAIVENYNQKRGWRQLLSIYVYSHCDFVKIKRYSPHSFDPGVRFSFPPHDESPHDKEYRYHPRPMPQPPVSRHMFNHLFNGCYQDGFVHRIYHDLTKTSHIAINSVPGKLLEGMPKRDRLVDEGAEFSNDEDVEVFWGLVAREQRSALRVVIYMLLALGPSLWFMFQWLFGWGQDRDLQNATVPLMFSAAMLGILGTVVYARDDVREVEQPR